MQDADGHWKLRIDLSRIVIPTREQVLDLLTACPSSCLYTCMLQMDTRAQAAFWSSLWLRGCSAETGLEHSGQELAAQDRPGRREGQDNVDFVRLPAAAGVVAACWSRLLCGKMYDSQRMSQHMTKTCL